MTNHAETLSAALRPIFEARALSKIYQMGERGVGLDLSPGELVVLLEANAEKKAAAELSW